jgi:hypothetical protein
MTAGEPTRNGLDRSSGLSHLDMNYLIGMLQLLDWHAALTEDLSVRVMAVMVLGVRRFRSSPRLRW